MLQRFIYTQINDSKSGSLAKPWETFSCVDMRLVKQNSPV